MSNQSIKNAFERMWQHSKNEFVSKDEISGLINSNEFIRKDDLDFTYNFETKTYNADPTKKYMGYSNTAINLNGGGSGHHQLLNNANFYGWIIEGEILREVSPGVYLIKQTLTTETGKTFFRSGAYGEWSVWKGELDYPTGGLATGGIPDFILGYSENGTHPITPSTGAYSNSVAVRDPDGKLFVKQHPTDSLEPTSKFYVDTNRVKVATNDKITKTIKFSEISWNAESMNINGFIRIDDELPRNSKLVVTFSDGKNPEELGIMNPSALEVYETDPFIENNSPQDMGVEKIILSEGSSINYSSDLYLARLLTNWTSGSFTSSYWNIIDPFEIVTTDNYVNGLYIGICEENIGIVDSTAFIERFGSVEIKIEYYTNESRSEHSITLYSNTEVHYNYPLTALTINGFESSYNPIDAGGNRIYPDEYSETWTLSFIAGDTTPLIILPEDVYFAGAEPIFEPGIFYYLTFKKFLNKYLCFWTTFGEGAFYV